MNWYKKIIIYSQIWETSEEESFIDAISNFYKLEYMYHSLKFYPFKGSPKRHENILAQVEGSLYKVMERLRDSLINTFQGWLQSHALTDASQWAERRLDIDDYSDGNELLSSIIYEYAEYESGGNLPHYKNINENEVFFEMLKNVMANIDQYPSLSGIKELLIEDQRQMLHDELLNEGFEEFGQNQQGYPFSSEAEAQTYIENMAQNIDIEDYLYSFEKESFINLLDNQGVFNQFLIELNKNLVFPLWYQYWSSMGIDETRETIENVYNELVNAKDFTEFRKSLEVAIQTYHQSGLMLDYLQEYGGEEDYISSKEVEEALSSLTEGKANAQWDKQLQAIGVKIPASVKKHNLQVSKV